MQWVSLLALYTLLALVSTYPLGWRAADMLIAQAYDDSLYSIWIFAWQARQLLIDPLHLFQANIYFPLNNTLAFSEIILPEVLGFLPLNLALANPVLAYNIILLALLPLNGLAMYLWVYHNLRERAGAVLAGAAFAFCTYVIGELRHVQLVAVLWIPLTFLYVQKFFERPTGKHIVLAAFFFLLNTLTSLYYALFLSLALGLYVGWMLLTRAWRLTRTHFILLGLGAAGLALVSLPFLWPFVQAERAFHFAAQRNPITFSARPASYLAVVPTNWIYGPLLRGFTFFFASRGQPMFLGVATVLLALVGLGVRPAWRRERGFWILLAVLGLVLSLGPALVLWRDNTPVSLPFSLPYAWIQWLPGLASLGAPSRFAVLAIFALCSLLAAGAARIAQRFGRWQMVAWVVLGVLVLGEHMASPLALSPVQVGADVPQVYRFLAQQPLDQPVVEIPMGGATLSEADHYGDYVYYATYHWHPLVNGYSSFLPDFYVEVLNREMGFPGPEALDLLRDLKVVWVVVHPKAVPEWWPKPAVMHYMLDGQEDFELVADYGDIWLYRIIHE